MAHALASLAITIGLSVLPISLARALPVRLPVAEGIWVKTTTSCSVATNVFVYAANRFGSAYFYGPNQSLGAADETEILWHTGRGKNGFTIVNDGPIEVTSPSNGQAAVRAYSLSEGPQWTESVRLCTKESVSPKLRSALVRLGLK